MFCPFKLTFDADFWLLFPKIGQNFIQLKECLVFIVMLDVVMANVVAPFQLCPTMNKLKAFQDEMLQNFFLCNLQNF
jgi:hypothetical protein